MSDSVPDLASAIEKGVTAPKSVSTESGSVSQHDQTQLIEADRYLRSRAAASNPFRALRRARLLFDRADGHTRVGSSTPPYPVDEVPQ